MKQVNKSQFMLTKLIKYISILLLIIAYERGNTQCCSPGNPMGGTTNQGTLDQKVINIISYFQYGRSGRVYKGSFETDPVLVKEADFNYSGIDLAYGINNKLTIEIGVGYYFNRTQVYDIAIEENKLTGFGFSDASLRVKYSIVKNIGNQFEISTGAGLRMPLHNNLQAVENVTLPLDIQPSSNAMGYIVNLYVYKGFIEHKIHLFMVNQFVISQKGKLNYKYGNSYFNAFFVSYIWDERWSITFQERNEINSHDLRKGQVVESSGSFVSYFTPQVGVLLFNEWNISLLFDLPLYRHYNGTQLAKSYNVAVSLKRRINI